MTISLDIESIVDKYVLYPVEGALDEIELYGSVIGIVKLIFFKQTSSKVCDFICTYKNIYLINNTVSKIAALVAYDNCKEPSLIPLVIIVNIVYLLEFILYVMIAIMLYKCFKPLIVLFEKWIVDIIENTFRGVEVLGKKVTMKIKEYEEIYTKHIEQEKQIPTHNKTK